MPAIKTPQGMRWNYQVKGEGPCLLLLHGWAADGRIWSNQVNYFARCYQVIALDLPGHGRSSWKDMTLEEMAGDIVFLMDALGIRRSNIMTSSMGALVAIQFCAMFSDRVRRLVLGGGLPKFSKSHDFPFGLEVPRIRKLGSQLDTDFPSILNVFYRSLFTIEERESQKFKWLDMFPKPADLPDKEALKFFLRILEKTDLRPMYRGLRMPVMLINGSEDYIAGRDALVFLQKELPRARLEILSGCSHFSFLTREEEFNHKVHEFLKEQEQSMEAPKPSLRTKLGVSRGVAHE